MIYILQIMYYFTPIPGLWGNRFSKWTIYDVGNVWQNVLGLGWGCGHDLLPYFTGWNSNWSSSAWGTLVVIKKGWISKSFSFFLPHFHRKKWAKKKNKETKKKRFNSFASVLVKLSRIGRNRAPCCFPYAATVAFVSCHLFVKEVSLRLSNEML